jgi:hypothetical protein
LRRTLALAEKLELENQQLRSQLVPTTYLREWSRRFVAYTRDALLEASFELRDALATESNPVRVREILVNWVELALTKFFNCEELWGATSKAK